MDDTYDFKMTLPSALEEKKEKVKGSCKKMAELFAVKSSVVSEGQDNVLFHLEFDEVEKLGEFLEYLQAQGVLVLDEVNTKNRGVN